jgi:tetratricopeptide (TPR) repeat protein
LTTRWQISAGELTAWLPPLLYAFAVLASAWVLHDARRRRFPLYAVALWTLATLIYAPVVLPLYLVARLFKPHSTDTPAAPAPTARQVADEHSADQQVADGQDTDEQVAGDQIADEQVADEHVAADIKPPTPRAPLRLRRYVSLRLRRYAPSLLYAAVLLAAGAFYFYRDYHSFDAHLARAANARLGNRRDATIREYRAALRIVDDAHTHKLLAVQLAEDGQAEAALAELRAAERGGEPDEMLTLRVASALDTLGRAEEALAAYEKFLRSESCSRPQSPAPQCVEAAARVRQLSGGGEAR